ncbi:MAG TPA: hypothetical protein VHF25_10115 [Nitriliruptorales bacterium]|nr:hypothetical protein [Nitriliruptorales bacterium]
MRRRARSLPAVLPLAGLLVSLTLLAPTAAADGNPSASGHANITVGDGQTRTFSFTAVRRPDGTVTGQAVVNNPSFPIRVRSRIDCLAFVGDRIAIASGPITQSSDPSTIAVGRIAVFAVEDNGEGGHPPPDRITTIPDYEPPKSCNEFSIQGDQLRDDTAGVNVRSLRPIDAGQIQVRP